MACEHVGGPELIEMAEEHLRRNSVAPKAWPGMKFRHTQNVPEGVWASVIVEIERRGNHWVVTRLDRRREAVPDSETGFRKL